MVYCDGTKKMLPQNESIKEHKINFWVQFTTAIFKKDFLIKNNIEFPEEMNVCEDIVFVTKSAILTNLIEIVPNANYYYIRRDDSLDSNQYNSQKIDSVINYVRTITNFIKEYDISLNDKQILLGRIVAQLDQIRKYKIEQNSEEYKILTKLYQQKVIEKMRLK